MKIRNGFVSNSSSSSFTCDLCGTESEPSWDTPNEWRNCDAGHCLCEEEENTNEDTGDVDCPICNFKKVGVFDMDRYLQKVTDITKAHALDTIKSFNKRRRALHTFDYQQYVFNKTGRTANQTEEEILSRFKNYDEFWDFMKKD